MQETIQILKINSLYSLPAIVTNPTKKIVDQYVEIASNRPDDLPLIGAGKVNGKHYIINRDEVYRACKQVGISEIKVNVTEYPKMTDVIVQHVISNKDPSSFDPLLVRNAVDYLAEQGIDENKAMRMFLLNNTTTEKLLKLPLGEKAIEKLRKLNETLSEKLTSVVMPAYIPAKVAKIPENKQVAAVEAIEALVMFETISDAKFAWPNPDMIEVALNEFIEKIKKSEEPVIAEIISDSTMISSKRPEEPVIKHSKATVTKATEMAKSLSNVIYIEGDPKNGRKDMVVDTKTARVAEIQNKSKVLALVGDLGSQTFIFPDSASKHLDLGNDGSAFMKKFSDMGELQTILNNAKKKKIHVSGVIFTKDKL